MSTQTGTGKYDALLAKCASLEPVATVVAHPCEKSALAAAVEAGELGLIAPILVGPAAKTEKVAKSSGIDVSRTEVVDAPHSHAAAAKAVELVRQGRAELLMKAACTRTSCWERSLLARPGCERDAGSATSLSWMSPRTTRS
jgi:phosphate acetyltransferase